MITPDNVAEIVLLAEFPGYEAAGPDTLQVAGFEVRYTTYVNGRHQAWELNSPTSEHILTGYNGWPDAGTVNPHAQRVAFACGGPPADVHICVHSIAGGRELAKFTDIGFGSDIEFSDDGRYLGMTTITSRATGAAHVWDLEQMAEILVYNSPRTS